MVEQCNKGRQRGKKRHGESASRAERTRIEISTEEKNKIQKREEAKVLANIHWGAGKNTQGNKKSFIG